MLSEEKRSKIIALRAAGTGVKSVARKVGVAVQTVYNVEAQYRKDHPGEFEEMKEEFSRIFAEKSRSIIFTALDRLKESLTDPNSGIAAKDLSTIIGTMYDKQALATGSATENTVIDFKLPQGLNEYAE